jgi:hypothetical protein
MTLAETGRCVRPHGMSRSLIVLLVCLLAPVGVRSQMVQGIVDGNPPVAASFVGPLDVVSSAIPLFCVSFRPCSGAIAVSGTQKMFALTAGAASCDFLATNSPPYYGNTANCSGAANGQTQAAFCSGGCVVQARYDQTAGGVTFNNFNPATSPTFTTTAGPSAGKAAMTCDNAAPQFLGATSPGNAQPYSLSSVAVRTSSFTTEVRLLNSISSPFTKMDFVASANQLQINSGNVAFVTAQTDASWHTFIGVYNGTSSSLKVDAGSVVTGTTGNFVLGSGSLYLCGAPPTVPGVVGEAEMIAFTGALSTNDQTALQSNQHTFLGF